MPSAFGIRVPLGDVKDLLTRLDLVKRSYRNKYLRSGIRKATRLVQTAARRKLRATNRRRLEEQNKLHYVDKSGRQRAHATALHNELLKRTGLLEQSMTTKVVVDEARGKVYGIVGPDVAVQGQRGTKRHVPANIAHLVEFGHAGPAPAPPHPFLRPAFDETKAAAMAAIRGELERGIVEAARKGL